MEAVKSLPENLETVVSNQNQAREQLQLLRDAAGTITTP